MWDMVGADSIGITRVPDTAELAQNWLASRVGLIERGVIEGGAEPEKLTTGGSAEFPRPIAAMGKAAEFSR